jgi:two-component system sensor histidine kinase PilS (NtrC family)
VVERKRLSVFVIIRLVVVSILFAATAFLFSYYPESYGQTAFRNTIILNVLTLLFSVALLLIARSTVAHPRYLYHVQLLWDVHYAAVLVVLTGGVTSPFSFLFFIIIIGASVSLSRRESLLCASLSSILHGSLIDLQYYGKLEFFGLSQLQATQQGAAFLLYTLFINIVAYFLVALLSGYLAERLRSSEHALARKVIDYEELERLNSAIVANLDSGLLTINNQGRIRVINRYAADLAGTSQEEAYDAALADIMPFFSGLQIGAQSYDREEVVYTRPDGPRSIFGYRIVPLFNGAAEREGYIVNFKDLTTLKRLEEKLQHADRLAAIGELAARIAHEIRNPLAAISGSVQLIAQGERVAVEDRKLLDIVLRETSRLNALITDFLAYARPSVPQHKSVDVRSFLEEFVAIARMDDRCVRCRIALDVPEDCEWEFDAGQMQQALWNLVLNAAEATAGQGDVQLRAYLGSLAPATSRGLCITVTDTGNGIPPQHLEQLFEPFFTSKAGGTGLGLATVYRIVAAHHGTIDVASRAGETTFSIWLPAALGTEGES